MREKGHIIKCAISQTPVPALQDGTIEVLGCIRLEFDERRLIFV